MKAVKKLYVETVSYKPQDFDFSKGYAEQWDIAIEQTDEEQENEEYAPMMNYLYPLPNDFERDMQNMFGESWRSRIKKVLENTTIVYFEESGEYFMALTGGGMDLSWEICESYVGLGYLPPLHFCDLPNMAGINFKRAKIRRVLAACKRSARVSRGWANQTLKHLKDLHSYSTNKA
jgi:hypothetical protein